MRNLHTKSFLLGIGSGIAIIVLLGAGMRLLHRTPSTGFNGNRQAWQQRGGAQGGQRGAMNGGGMNLDAMAERLGMTPEELRKEMQSGKRPRDIAAERGIDWSQPPGSSSAVSSSAGSGAVMVESSSSSSSLQ